MLRQPFSSVVYSVLLALLFTAGSVQAQDILNGNGGFEAYDLGPVSDTNEWFFQVSEENDATLTIVDDPVHEGDRALSVEVAGTTGANLQFSNQNIDVTTSGPGTYRYSGWARASEDGAQLQVVGDQHGGDFTWFGNTTETLSTEWTEITLEFEVPEVSGDEAVTAIRATHILKFDENIDKTIYLDNVRVWKVEDDEPGDEGLVASWDFEDEELGDWAAGDGVASIEVSDEQADDSDYAVKLVNSNDRLDINLQNDNLGDVVQAGDVVSVRVWISQEHLDDVNGFQGFWQDEGDTWAWNGEWLGKDGVTGDAWNTLEFTIDEIIDPLNRVGLQLLLSEGNEATEAVLYVDNITITREDEGGGVMTIAEARAAGVDATVTVEGVVTRAMGAFTYIQDETGGLTIRQTSGDFADDVADGTIAPGTQLSVTGTLSEFASLLQINGDDLTSYEVGETTDVPAPQAVTLQDLTDNGEDYEAELVEVSGLTTDATGTFEEATSYDVTDASGSGVLRIPNEGDSEVDGTDIPEEAFTFTGVVGQFHDDDPAAGYQLLAIGAADIQDDTGSSTAPGDVPHQFALEQNYPNPFNPTTTIEYELDANTHVTLTVYNALGQHVATLVDAPQAAGRHHAQFDARGFASGMYFYRITAGDHIMTRQMTLVK